MDLREVLSSEATLMDRQDFNKLVGFHCIEFGDGYCKGEIVLNQMHTNPIGSIHGGVLFTLADVVGGNAAFSSGRFPTTLSSSMNFLRPVIGCERLIGESREVKNGKNVAVYEVTITDEKDNVIAVATMTYFYLPDHVQKSLQEKYRLQLEENDA